MLALLLLNAGRVVSTDSLVDALWGESPPRTAGTSLQNFVSQLRKVLGAETLVTRPPGYVLAVEPSASTSSASSACGERGARAAARAARRDAARARSSSGAASALADFRYEPWAEIEAARLDELRLATVEERIDAELEPGRDAALVGELEALVAEHPLRERLRGQLMLALYRSGRQAEALETYQSLRRALVDELGIEPGPALQQLNGAILRQEVSLEPVARGARPPRTTSRRSSKAIARRAASCRCSASDVGELARPPRRALRLPRRGRRADPRLAVRRGDAGLRARSGTSCTRCSTTAAQPTPIHRFFASLPPLLRERGAPHQLIVTTSYDLALEQALLDAGEEFDVVSYIASGRHRGRFCHLAPDGTAAPIEHPEHLRDGAVARAAHDHPQAPRPLRPLAAARVGELRRHRGRLHRVPRAVGRRRRRCRSGSPRGSSAATSSSSATRWPTGTCASCSSGSGATTRSATARGRCSRSAKPLEREFWRRLDVDVLEAPLEEYVELLGRHLECGAA